MLIPEEVRSVREQLKALRQLSATDGRSTAKLMRNAIDQFLSGECATSAPIQIERAVRVAGKFSSGRCDVSANHDRHLAEAFRK